MEKAASGTPGNAARRTAVTFITAIQAFSGTDGRWQTGLCVRLSSGAPIEICGPGFSSRTVLARSEGSYYFVLRDSVVRHNRHGLQ